MRRSQPLAGVMICFLIYIFSANRRFEFDKRSQLFIRTHNKTVISVATRISNPDGSPVGINRRDTAQTPTGFAEKADHRAIHFRIKSGSGQRVHSGHSSEQDLPQHANERQATAYCQKTREWL
jgi:hypothetical protein